MLRTVSLDVVIVDVVLDHDFELLCRSGSSLLDDGLLYQLVADGPR